MGIDALFETNPGEILRLDGERVSSRSIASLVENQMYYQTFREESENDDPARKELINWFDRVTAAMHTDIALLAKSSVFEWTYTEDQYEAYVRDWERFLSKAPPDAPPTMPRDEFLKTCLDTWADITIMRDTIDDLVTAIEEIHPPDTYWYEEEYGLRDLRLLSRALSEAYAQGHSRVRIQLG